MKNYCKQIKINYNTRIIDVFIYINCILSINVVLVYINIDIIHTLQRWAATIHCIIIVVRTDIIIRLCVVILLFTFISATLSE